MVYNIVIDTQKETNASEEITYSTINYNDEMDISGQTLKKMLNKTENSTFITNNETIEK